MSTIETPSDEPTTEAASGGEAAEPTLTADQTFRLLQSERRRAVLRHLRREGGTVRVHDVAEQVAAREHDTPVQALTPAERERVSVSLYHSHLPKLDEAGVVEYDRDRDVVERTPLADRLDRFLSPVDGDAATDRGDSPWDRYYLGATGLCAFLFAGTAFGVGPLTALSGVALSAVVLTVFAALTATKIATSGDAPER